MTQEQWDQAVHSVRTPVGSCLSRALRSRKLVDPPGSKGPYVVLQFDTALEHQEGAVETVTPVLVDDDCWRVAG